MPDDTTKVLNLYAGIGGNRKLWDEVTDVEVTAVEWDEERARAYSDFHPDDTVVVDDAHEYLKNHYEEYDFIWSSPPCPTHSKMRRLHPHVDEVYPDMRLYQEIIFLKHNFEGDYVVENVDPYYEPLIEPLKRGRHSFWSNFHIPPFEGETQGVRRDTGQTIEELQEHFGFDTTPYNFGDDRDHRKTLNNCVDPELGKHILKAATTDRQTTLL